MNISEMIKYLKLIINKWVLWLFVLLDIIGVLAQFLFPNLALPPIAYGFFAIIGFFWAGYQVYTETVISYENSLSQFRQDMQRLNEEINIEALLKEQNLSINLKEGHEYSFNILLDEQTLQSAFESMESFSIDTKNNQRKYFPPPSNIILHFRVENIGCDVDVIDIDVYWDKEYNSPVDFEQEEIFLSTNEKIDFPLSLASDSYFECISIVRLSPRLTITTAQFASRIRDLRESDALQKMQIRLESVDRSGQRKMFTIEKDISFRPLVDLYIEHWQNSKQNELIRLAGGVTTKIHPQNNQ